jgi:hypothetical protein
MDSLWNSTRTLKEELMPAFLKLFHKKRQGMIPDSFYKSSISLVPKLDKDTIKKENYRPVSLMNIATKNF